MAELTFTSGKESLPAYQTGKGDKGVILIHDVFGYKYDEMRRIADLIAQAGFDVIVPDLYRGKPYEMDWGWDKFPEWLKNHPDARIQSDIKAAAQFMRTRVKKLAILGFCWGGLQAFNAGKTGLFDSVVDFYGSRMDPATAKEITCPFFGIFGDKDQGIPLEQVHALEAELKKAKKNFQVKIFKDCNHAFVQKRDNYNEQASKEALADAITWLKKTL
jgi:carboxymethylenebutenolidase